MRKFGRRQRHPEPGMALAGCGTAAGAEALHPLARPHVTDGAGPWGRPDGGLPRTAPRAGGGGGGGGRGRGRGKLPSPCGPGSSVGRAGRRCVTRNTSSACPFILKVAWVNVYLPLDSRTAARHTWARGASHLAGGVLARRSGERSGDGRTKETWWDVAGLLPVVLVPLACSR